jgi:phosphoglycerate dehydrogenase-like enzyme
MKLVLFPAVEAERLEKIRVAFPSEIVNARSAQDALGAVADADAFFGKMTPEILGAALRLRWIQCPTASLEHYLFPQLIRHPAVLTNMRGIFSDVVADHVLGLVLCFARNLHIYVRRQLEARWEPCGGEATRPPFDEGQARVGPFDLAVRHLPDQTLGIVGFGAIGREVARRASAFGMRLLAVDADPEASGRRDSRGLPGSLTEIWSTARLDELLASSDFLCITAPQTPRTTRLFRAPQFQRMRRNSVLINVGRGAIVDLDDLVEALRAGRIAGAGLDVFSEEPLRSSHPLWSMENVIITPHVASASPRVAERHLELLLENLRRFQDDRPLLNVVSKENWY